jgi:glycoside/pentoside/hexuronide:cation symporter, GPH family
MSPPPHTSVHRETLAKDRIPPKEQLGLGLGALAAAGSHGTLNVLVNPFFNIILGVNPAVLSTIVFAQRFWDAMIDPLIGQYSDNFRSRWGRRKPLILASAPLVALLFIALWWFPAGSSPSVIATYFLVASLLFYSALTLFAMPLAGLTLEATDDYHERTRIASITLFFGFAFSILSQWIFPFAQSSFFPDTVTGVRWVTAGCAVAFFFAALAPVFFCRERNYERVAARQPKLPLLPSLREAANSKPFMLLLGTRFVSSFGYNLVALMAAYMNTYYVFGGNIKEAFKAFAFIGSTFHIVAIVCSLFIYPRLSRRFGKRVTIQIAAGTLIVGCLCKIFLYHPGQPWWQLLIIGCNGAALSGIGLVSASMLGDISDYDEWKNGTRREALFSSLMAWIDKTGGSIGYLISGYLLVVIGFNAAHGAQSESTLFAMKWSYVVCPFLGALLAIFLMQAYTLTEEQAYRIKDELAKRRAEEPS